jgi:hypothetical protein
MSGSQDQNGRESLENQLYVANRTALADATDLITRFGELAKIEAANRADKSRSLGNVIQFCHWRQIERLIDLLARDHVMDTVH